MFQRLLPWLRRPAVPAPMVPRKPKPTTAEEDREYLEMLAKIDPSSVPPWDQHIETALNVIAREILRIRDKEKEE